MRDLVTGGSVRVVWGSRLERGSLADGNLDRSVLKTGCPGLEWPRQGCTSLSPRRCAFYTAVCAFDVTSGNGPILNSSSPLESE